MSRYSMTLGQAMPAENGKSRLAVALKAMGDRFVAAQHARAQRMVRPYLARISEEDLKVLGYSAAEIESIRKNRHLPVVSAY